MSLEKMIYKLRTQANLSQEKFAQMLGVSHQAVQKWESGTTMPDLKNLIKMAKYFHISLDALVLDRDIRIVEELKGTKEILDDPNRPLGIDTFMKHAVKTVKELAIDKIKLCGADGKA